MKIVLGILVGVLSAMLIFLTTLGGFVAGLVVGWKAAEGYEPKRPTYKRSTAPRVDYNTPGQPQNKPTTKESA